MSNEFKPDFWVVVFFTLGVTLMTTMGTVALLDRWYF